MAKLRMTYKNLKALRKSKEYQALLVDLVSVGVVPKATAEGLLGYNIPANLITDDKSSGTDDPINEGTEGSGTVTLLYWDQPANGKPYWESTQYDLTDDPTVAGILAFAKAEFGNATINNLYAAEVNPEYVEGAPNLVNKYISLDPQPETFEPGMLIVASYPDNNVEIG